MSVRKAKENPSNILRREPALIYTQQSPRTKRPCFPSSTSLAVAPKHRPQSPRHLKRRRATWPPSIPTESKPLPPARHAFLCPPHDALYPSRRLKRGGGRREFQGQRPCHWKKPCERGAMWTVVHAGTYAQAQPSCRIGRPWVLGRNVGTRGGVRCELSSQSPPSTPWVPQEGREAPSGPILISIGYPLYWITDGVSV